MDNASSTAGFATQPSPDQADANGPPPDGPAKHAGEGHRFAVAGRLRVHVGGDTPRRGHQQQLLRRPGPVQLQERSNPAYDAFVGLDDLKVQTCQGGAGYNSWYGNGLVDAFNAVTHTPWAATQLLISRP